jgi:hypothetical protein
MIACPNSLMFTNQYGTFNVKVGCKIACYPFVNSFFTVVSINGHNDCRVITVLNDDNSYDTRNIVNVITVVD